MISSVIREELKKNRVQDNYSNKFEKIFFREYEGNNSYPLSIGADNSYGFLFVSCENPDSFRIGLNGVTVFEEKERFSKLVPIRYKNGDILTLDGRCKKLMVLLYGAEANFEKGDRTLYLSKKYIENCGDISKIYSFSDFTTGKDGFELINKEAIEGIGELEYNGEVYLCKIILEDSRAYLCTELDNFANKIMLNFEYDDIIITRGYGENVLTIVYLNNGNVYYRSVDSSLNIGEENIVTNNMDYVTKLISIDGDNSYPAFAINLANGNTSVYTFYLGKFCLLSSIKSRKGEFCIIGNNFYSIFASEYEYVIKKFQIASSFDGIMPISSRKITMADYVKIYDDICLVDYNLQERICPLDSI